MTGQRKVKISNGRVRLFCTDHLSHSVMSAYEQIGFHKTADTASPLTVRSHRQLSLDMHDCEHADSCKVNAASRLPVPATPTSAQMSPDCSHHPLQLSQVSTDDPINNQLWQDERLNVSAWVPATAPSLLPGHRWWDVSTVPIAALHPLIH